MPTYEFSCKDCGMNFEEFMTMTEYVTAVKDETIQCHKCDSKNVKQEISGGNGHILKGAGWYKDGYK